MYCKVFYKEALVTGIKPPFIQSSITADLRVPFSKLERMVYYALYFPYSWPSLGPGRARFDLATSFVLVRPEADIFFFLSVGFVDMISIQLIESVMEILQVSNLTISFVCFGHNSKLLSNCTGQ
jgi:hypothetical protein